MTTFDTTPKPGFMLAMQNQKWDIAGALAELCDNSFGFGRGNGSLVIATYNQRRRTIDVLDNGRGMDAIGRLFQLGNTIGRSPGDIGIYGSGGTMALLWLSSRVEIWTLRDGKVQHDTVEWKREIAKDQYPQVSDVWRNATPANTPEELLELQHGTLIRLHLLRERSPIYPQYIQRDLTTLFSPGLRQGKSIVWKTIGTETLEIALAEPVLTFSQPPTRFDGRVDLSLGDGDEITLSFSGEVGAVDNLPLSRHGIDIGFGSRVIVPHNRECFKSQQTGESYSGNGVTGWIDLGEGWQPYLATTKDAVNDRGAWLALLDYVFEQIKPLLQKLSDEKSQALFDELQIQLNAQIFGKSKIRLDAAAGDGVAGVLDIGNGTGEGGGGEARGDGDDASGRASEKDGTDAKKKSPALSMVTVERCTEVEMESELCRADVENDTIRVFINKDHDAVMKATNAKPTNKQAFYFMIAREIAESVQDHDEMLKRMFPKHLQQIEGRKNGGKARLINRLLLDRVRSGTAFDDEAHTAITARRR